jgi:uncharacterized membrane protein required for colicin V production
MGPVELIFISIGLVVTLIGLARGYVKELGSTLIILVAIFILTFFEDQLSGLLTAIGTALGGGDDTQSNELLLSTTYSIIFVVIVFGAYAGRTLNFTGTPAPPPQGTLISILIGALNGYLIAGTLWYYQHTYNYPIGQIVTFQNTLTDTAQTLVEYLPPSLFDNPVYWIVPVAVLLIIRVRG